MGKKRNIGLPPSKTKETEEKKKKKRKEKKKKKKKREKEKERKRGEKRNGKREEFRGRKEGRNRNPLGVSICEVLSHRSWRFSLFLASRKILKKCGEMKEAIQLIDDVSNDPMCRRILYLYEEAQSLFFGGLACGSFFCCC